MIQNLIRQLQTLATDYFSIIKKVREEVRSKSADRTASEKEHRLSPKKKPRQPKNDFIESKKQSMQDSQGISDFSGSSYNGPGNVDREKTNSNMGQRNY